MNALWLVLLLLLPLTGCASVASVPSETGGRARLTLTPRYQSGEYRAQAQVAQLDLDSVDHVVIALHRLTSEGEAPVVSAGGVPVTAELQRSELDSPITFGQLAGDTTYRVRATAYRASGNAAIDRISLDALSYVDVAVGSEDRPTMAPLTVRLAATPFAATATVTLSATGSVHYTSLDVGLYAVAGEAETPIATRRLRAEDVPGVVAFTNLQAMTTYRLKATALDLNGQAIAGADAQLDLPVGDDTAVATASLQVAIP